MAPVAKICASHVEHSAVNHQRLRVEGPFATQAFADENLRALLEQLSDGSLLFLKSYQQTVLGRYTNSD